MSEKSNVYTSSGSRAIEEMKARRREQQKDDLREQLPMLIEVLLEDKEQLGRLAAALGVQGMTDAKPESKSKK